MPSLTPDAALRSHLDSQIGVLAELNRKSYDTLRRLSELNLELTRDLADDYYAFTRRMVSTSDPMQFSNLMARSMEPFGERMRSYAQQLSNLLSGVQVDLTRATENFMPEISRAFAGASMRTGPDSVFNFSMFTPRRGGNGPA